MKTSVFILLIFIGFWSCQPEQQTTESVVKVNWSDKKVEILPDSLIAGSTYLSVYSQIYSQTEQTIYDLTATVSIRNTSRMDTVYLERAEYFDTKGNSIRSYISQPIFLAPMETVEIVIQQADKEGGTGANFLFDWKIPSASNEPYFEAVMISTSGTQGLSFTTKGVRLK